MSYFIHSRSTSSRLERPPALVLGALLGWALACSVAGTEATGTETGTDSGQSGSTTANSTSAGPGSTSTASASGSDGESMGGSSTGVVGTSTGGTDPDATSGFQTSTGDDTDSTGTTEGTTTGGESGPCESDADCVLVSDCCECKAALVGEPVDMCDAGCDEMICELLEIDAAVCVAGQCVPHKTHCDDALILCDAIPPDCPPNTVPGVTADNSCWTGLCVPANLCDVVPACDVCEAFDGWECVVNVTQLGPKPHCEPLPADCEGVATCECASELCVAPYDVCADEPDGLACSCPVC